MRKKNINKSLYESIMAGVSKAVKKLLLLNEMTHNSILSENIFTDDNADLLDDESVLDKYLSGGRYIGIQGLIDEPDKDKVFKFGTILFVKGGFDALAVNNNLEIIADNFKNPTFDDKKLRNIIKNHKKEGRLPFAFCFGKNDDGVYAFGLPGNGKEIRWCSPAVLKEIEHRKEHSFGYAPAIKHFEDFISHECITDKLIHQKPDNLLHEIYTYRDMFNNKLTIDAPDEYVCELLKKIYNHGNDPVIATILLDILKVKYTKFWTNTVSIIKAKGCYTDLDSSSFLCTFNGMQRSIIKPRSWFLTFTV